MLELLELQRYQTFLVSLEPQERPVVAILLAIVLATGIGLGRLWRQSSSGLADTGKGFQNAGEAQVARLLQSRFCAPDYHLMNHVTIRMEDGTTQVDHILISRYGVFVIETKSHNGWVFANANDKMWTTVKYHRKLRYQNPIRQNYRHVLAVQQVLDFVPHDAIHSLVVFTGNAQFRTSIPDGVVLVEQLIGWLQSHTTQVLPLNRMQYAVGRLETGRLALSGKTDVEHVESLNRRHGYDTLS